MAAPTSACSIKGLRASSASRAIGQRSWKAFLSIWDRGRIIRATPAAESELGQLAQVDGNGALVSLGGRPLTELIATPPEGLGHEIRSDGRIYEVTPHPASSGPEPESYVVLISDVTHARQVQNEMSRQERLAAVGQLAAGIAHDFNNILAVIVLYAQMGLQDKSLPTRLRSYIATIFDQAHHAASLVQQILDFGRRAMLDPQPVNLAAFVTEQAALLARTLPDDIRVEIQAGASDADASDTPASIYVSADVTRLQQLVTNLVVNARDAMPEGGTLTMSVMRLTISEGDAAPWSRWPRAVGRNSKCAIRVVDGCRRAGAPVRTLLHDQGTWPGDWIGIGPGLRHRQATPRAYPGSHRSGHRHRLRHLPAPPR